MYAGLERVKNEVRDVGQTVKGKVTQEQVEALLVQMEFLSKDLGTKGDKRLVEQLTENVTQLTKDMLLKADQGELCTFVEKKAEELCVDMALLKSSLQKQVKEFL